MKAIPMTRVKMLRNKHGSPDGVRVNHYEKDVEYDLPEGLAKAFVETDRVAEYLDVEKAEKPVKNKAEKPLKNKGEEDVA